MVEKFTHLEAGGGDAPKDEEVRAGRSAHASRGAKKTKKRKAWAAQSSGRQSTRQETEDLAHRYLNGEDIED